MNAHLDVLALPLEKAALCLNEKKLKYRVRLTSPAKKDKLDGEKLFVIRQQIGADDIYELVVASKFLG